MNRGVTREEIRTVYCPQCKANPGSRCTRQRKEIDTNHKARMDLYIKVKPPRNQKTKGKYEC